MASRKFVLPYMLRELVVEAGSTLNLPLGVPMNGSIPEDTDEVSQGKAELHFEMGCHLKIRVETYRDTHFGQVVHILGLKCRLYFYRRQEAREWISHLQEYSGPFEWSWRKKEEWVDEDGEGFAVFELSGMTLVLLQADASNRSNGLPRYRADDPQNPTVVWANEHPGWLSGVHAS